MNSAEPKADESEAAAPDILRAGSSFARYEIVRCIGVGGMGAVFEATHSLLRKRVALKTMHTNLGRSEASRARFLREAETVARIRHPNVVDISDLGIENGIPFLVMDYLEGEDLSQFIERRGPLSIPQAIDIVVPIAAGLAAVHRLGIIHRDVKPENVFLARDAQGVITPKLIDFGVSKDLDASLRGGAAFPHTVTGTPHYMSPEQARGSAALDGRTDQYALGIVLYQCLTGRLPYESGSLLELLHLLDTGEFTPIRSLRPEVEPELEATIHRAMSRHLRDRFPSMEAFGQALLPFAGERLRITHEHEFQLLPISTEETLLALDQSLRQSAATTPAGLLDGLQRTRTQTSSGVRMRERGQAEAHTAQATGAASGADSNHGAVRTSRRGLAWMALGAILAAGLLALIVRSVGSSEKKAPAAAPIASTLHLTVSASPAEALFELDGVVLGQGAIDRRLPRDGREHLLRISAPGHESQILTFREEPPSQTVVALQALPAPVVPVAPTQPALEAPKPTKARAARAHTGARSTERPQPGTPAQAEGVDIQLTR